MDAPLPLTLNGYQQSAIRTDVSKGKDSASFLLLGLFGEAGSVLAAVKKKERDRTLSGVYILGITEELGDLLWYISAVAARNDITLNEIGKAILGSHRTPAPAKQSEILTFRDLQPERKILQVEPNLLLEWRLVDLADMVGQLIVDHRKFLKDRIRASLVASFANVLTEILWVANRVGISLEDAALDNLRKTQSRWPTSRLLPERFDRRYPPYERLPTQISVDIIEEQLEGDNYFVYQVCNGINIGDRLTDNISDPDEYRFHDVFHYAYAAVLGWSPVLRSLFKTKRKSAKKVDEGQDGARAILIEEGISAIVFNEAKRSAFFERVDRGKLSFDLLKTIKNFVKGYEVDVMPYWAWEDAILQGYEAFRFLKRHRKGTVTITRRKLVVGPLEE